MKKTSSCLALLLTCLAPLAAAKTFSSPDGRLAVQAHRNTGQGLTVFFDGKEALEIGGMDLVFQGGRAEPGGRPLALRSNRLRRETIRPEIPLRRSLIESRFRELVFSAGPGLELQLRLYDRALAYRFRLTGPGSRGVEAELVEFRPAGDPTLYFPEEKSLQSHYEGHYRVLPLSGLEEGRLAHLPLLARTDSGLNLLFSEADVHDYPCLFLRRSAAGLAGLFPRIVSRTAPRERGPDRNESIVEEEELIARVSGPRPLPWRLVMVSDDDRDLLGPELVYELSRPAAPGTDWSWVRPGKVAWDWWNANNLFGVPFRSGLNTETYRAYIDFAADFGLEYVILDEGWSKSTLEVLDFNPDIDVPKLLAYAKNRGVGIILWLLWKPLDNDLENILDQYAAWGAKGIKVDFMQRADQYMVNFYERVARAAAARRLLVNFHGSFKPTGLHRAYPNVLSYEGVRGLEHAKWSDLVTPGHNLLLPFIRMSAGPMDYTPGAMENAGPGEFKARFNRPMSQGTRAQQLALYVAYESLLQMLCDSPSRYRLEEECARFMARIPVSWDETLVLEARVGEYLVLARRRGDSWYLAALTDWTAREFEVELSFLPAGRFRLENLADGINADRHAHDHRFEESRVEKSTRLALKLAPGGGWLGIISPAAEAESDLK